MHSWEVYGGTPVYSLGPIKATYHLHHGMMICTSDVVGGGVCTSSYNGSRRVHYDYHELS